MENNFDLGTFMLKDGGFLEYEDIESYVNDNGDRELNDVIGYFKKHTNVTLEECKEDTNYLICYISSEDGSHLTANAGSRYELITGYNKLITIGQDDRYINIYRLKDMTYI